MRLAIAGGLAGEMHHVARQGIIRRDVIRVRIGISRPGNKGSRYADEDEIVDYVLGDFPPEEADIIQTAVTGVAEAVECILADGLETAMNMFNKRGTGI